MKNLFLLALAFLGGTGLSAQMTITSGSHLTVNANSVLTIINADVNVDAGGSLTNQGIVYTNQTFATAGTMITEVSGTTPGVDFGRVTADVKANLNGTFTATKSAGYNPAGQVSHVIVLGGTVTDVFGTENLPGPLWELDYTPTALDLVFDAALPVTWLSFTGEATGKRIDLHWATANEENTDFFAVERQTVSGDWQTIGRVDAAGNARTVNHYAFPDDAPGPTDPVHYRLRQTDLDGHFGYSAAVAVRRATADTQLLYPNPTPGTLTLQKAGDGHPYQVLDASGRVVLEGRTRGEVTRIELPGGLVNGTYVLRVREDGYRFQLVR